MPLYHFLYPIWAIWRVFTADCPQGCLLLFRVRDFMGSSPGHSAGELCFIGLLYYLLTAHSGETDLGMEP